MIIPLDPNISVQGELCGSSIMGNTMKLPEGEHRFVVFGIWNFDTAAYVDVKVMNILLPPCHPPFSSVPEHSLSPRSDKYILTYLIGGGENLQ